MLFGVCQPPSAGYIQQDARGAVTNTFQIKKQYEYM